MAVTLLSRMANEEADLDKCLSLKVLKDKALEVGDIARRFRYRPVVLGHEHMVSFECSTFTSIYCTLVYVDLLRSAQICELTTFAHFLQEVSHLLGGWLHIGRNPLGELDFTLLHAILMGASTLLGHLFGQTPLLLPQDHATLAT